MSWYCNGKGWIDIQPFLIWLPADDYLGEIERFEAPTTTYSTAFAFNNLTNSRKSLVNGIRVATIAEFNHELEALLRGHARISFIGFVKTSKKSVSFSPPLDYIRAR
jgi:hypothetical protein